MNDPQLRLEHLISRCLDNEASDAERAELAAWKRSEPTAAHLWAETEAVDQAAREALQAILQGGSRPRVLRLPWWSQAIGLAAAAVVTLVLWLAPPTDTGGAHRASASGSWFLPTGSEPRADEVVDVPPTVLERPTVRQHDRNWILIPGEQPGEYLVIEIDEARTRVARVGKDF